MGLVIRTAMSYRRNKFSTRLEQRLDYIENFRLQREFLTSKVVTLPAFVVANYWLGIGGLRLRQMLQLIRKVRESSHGDLSLDWLKPFMTGRKCRKGEVIFCKDDAATEMFYTVSGRFRLVELGIDVPAGQVIGRTGLLASENHRTPTLECIEDGAVLTISYASVEQLHFQNPKFGFYFPRLATHRLFQNIVRLEGELARERAVARSPSTRPAEAG